MSKPAKPHLHPIRAPNGRVLTCVSPPDHEWHRGLWFAIKYVNGENFWEEPTDQPHGNQVDVGGGRIEWVSNDGTVVLDEHRTVKVLDPVGEGPYAIDWTTKLVPRAEVVVLDRTPFTSWGGYGGLTFRGAGEWADTRMVLADGSEHHRPEGVPSPWCDLSGPDAGITFLDHPNNINHPVPWYGATRSRVYGEGWSNYLNAAFLFNEALVIEAGSELELRYRLMVHGGNWDLEDGQRSWDEWVAGG